MMPANSRIALIMNTRPPKLVGIWAAFSVSNCGNNTPNDRASEPAAIVKHAIVITLKNIMNGEARRISLVTTVIVTATIRSGAVPTQYLLHSIARRSSGLDLSSHNCRPSSDTDGKMNRAAIAARTNPASPWFRKTTSVTSR